MPDRAHAGVAWAFCPSCPLTPVAVSVSLAAPVDELGLDLFGAECDFSTAQVIEPPVVEPAPADPAPAADTATDAPTDTAPTAISTPATTDGPTPTASEEAVADAVAAEGDQSGKPPAGSPAHAATDASPVSGSATSTAAETTAGTLSVGRLLCTCILVFGHSLRVPHPFTFCDRPCFFLDLTSYISSFTYRQAYFTLHVY